MDFTTTADELYALLPSEFTEARDARARAARAESDGVTADALKALRRPTVGAWLANQIVRRRADEVDRLLELAEQLREAQGQLDGERMRSLSSEGRDAVASLVRHASRLAGDLGVDVSESALQDLQATLDAALADPDSAAALRAGRLTSALHYSGLGLADAMAASAASGRHGPGRQTVPPTAHRELERATKELERLRTQLRDAQSAVSAAETTLAERKETAERAARRVREAEKSVRKAESQVRAHDSGGS